MERKLNRNFIQGTMYYAKFKDLDGKEKYAAAKDMETLEYRSFQSAYNPLYPDAGKIVRIPENYLYPNERHHLKDFVIIDGKEDQNGNQVIIGFLGTSQINKKTKKLTATKPNELIAITRVVISKNKYHKLIKKSKSYLSNKELSQVQLCEVKEQAKTEANIHKSRDFRR